MSFCFILNSLLQFISSKMCLFSNLAVKLIYISITVVISTWWDAVILFPHTETIHVCFIAKLQTKILNKLQYCLLLNWNYFLFWCGSGPVLVKWSFDVFMPPNKIWSIIKSDRPSVHSIVIGLSGVTLEYRLKD